MWGWETQGSLGLRNGVVLTFVKMGREGGEGGEGGVVVEEEEQKKRNQRKNKMVMMMMMEKWEVVEELRWLENT